MKRICLISVCCLIMMPFAVSGLELDRSLLLNEIQNLKFTPTHYRTAQEDDQTPVGDFDLGFGVDESIYEYDYKSPKRAFVYSLMIPGWGQKYAGSHVLKSLFFIGVEAGLWMGYFGQQNNGDKKTTEYENWADLHWIEGDKETATATDSSYVGWLLDNFGEADDENIESDSITHHLPDRRDQQYYEMIGKYDQFRAGWDDYWNNPFKYDSLNFYTSPNRESYLNMRKDANDFYDTANRFLIFTVLNHLVSAFDAALAARRNNRGQTADAWLSLKTEMKRYSATESIPYVKLTYRF